MKPLELTSVDEFKKYVEKLCGGASINLTYNDAMKVLRFESLQTAYGEVAKGNLKPQGNSKPARIDDLGLFDYMNNRGWIPA